MATHNVIQADALAHAASADDRQRLARICEKRAVDQNRLLKRLRDVPELQEVRELVFQGLHEAQSSTVFTFPVNTSESIG